MVSTAVSRRQRREAQRRTQRSHRRTLTVIISALTTIVLFAGYCAADITDVAPGLLTLKPVTAPVFANPATAKSGGTIAGALNANKAIDSTAASVGPATHAGDDFHGEAAAVICEPVAFHH